MHHLGQQVRPPRPHHHALVDNDLVLIKKRLQVITHRLKISVLIFVVRISLVEGNRAKATLYLQERFRQAIGRTT